MTSDKPKFTHRVYIDFSGDLGDAAKAGSTKTVCIAWVLTSEENRKYNENVLLDIKKSIGCKQEDEIKYRSIRRHPKKDEVLSKLKDFKVDVTIVTVLKELTGTKILSGRQIAMYLHEFPWQQINRHFNNIAGSIMKCNTWRSRKEPVILSDYGKTILAFEH